MQIDLAGIDPADIPACDDLVAALSDEPTLGGLLSRLRRELASRALIASVVVVDGQPLLADEERQKTDVPLETVESLQVEVAAVEPFLQGVFEGCTESLSKLLDLKEQISQYVRAGKTQQAFESLERFTDGFGVIVSAYRNGLSLLSSVGVATDADLATCLETLRGVEVAVREVLNGVDRRDHVLISDALEYEFPGQLETLREELRSWSERLQVAGRGS